MQAYWFPGEEGPVAWPDPVGEEVGGYGHDGAPPERAPGRRGRSS